MFGLYGQRMRMRRAGGMGGWDSPPTIGHDSMNYMNPTINYDKWPRKIRPRKWNHQREQMDLDLDTNTPREPSRRRCSCMENVDVVSEGSSRRLHHDNEDCWLLQQQQQTDSTLQQGAEALSRMFTCLALDQQPEPARSPKHGGRYSYSALEDDGAGERLELERKAARGASRETASLAARSYVRTQPRYSILEHLPDVGSRIDKNWFLVKDTTVKTERLMTLLPYDEACPIPLAQGTKEALIELFQALQHPYIYPVLDMDFASISNHCYVISVLPYNQKGTLKDLIYRSHWQEDWGEKYQQRSSGLPVSQVQRLGRQVLEALLFLQDRGFPPCGHVHSGNIILQNGVARLSGIENTLLGLTSRIYPIIRKRLRDNRDAIDSVSFGHVLFEMCAGYELSAAHPTLKHLEDIAGYPQVLQVLDFIFGSGEQYPSIEEILCLDFFRNLDLREMRAMPIPARYSPVARNILREVRRHQKQRNFNTLRRGHSLTRTDYSTSPSEPYKDQRYMSWGEGPSYLQVTPERRGRRGGGGCSTGGGEGGSSTPPSTEAAAAASTTGGSGGGTAAATDPSGWRGDSEEASAALQSSYTTPSASMAALTSPSSDVTPSPEHPTHRFLEVSSPTRQLASSCSSSTQQEVYHTPPHTPPTPQNHPIKSNLMNHHLHHHHTHNDRPLLTTNRCPPKASSSSSPASSPRGVYWSGLQHNHHYQQHHHHSPQHHHHSPQHHQQQPHAGENGQTSCSSGGSSGSSGHNILNNNNNATKKSGSSPYPWT
ncbi:uncharacterized protein LOC143036681 isoform X4 [Oratosquilla oratoria]|uniref:uncharacterized protein LOC143036681 isoform X4 n=1 Tax=Oratosquilla oratoria TaxID=337810 RepID=UPI003F764DBF